MTTLEAQVTAALLERFPMLDPRKAAEMAVIAVATMRTALADAAIGAAGC